jgi:pimeloyl-ACP methyl ester carboxylesterase
MLRDRTEPPVVLVHGFAASRTCWFAVRRALRADGRTVVSFDYSPWASSVDELADRLVDTVEDLLAVTGADKAHLVGHSLGGVIIAQALTRDRLAGRVDLVATLGSPFGGTLWAGLLPVGPLVRALRPSSPLLRRLAATPPPEGVRWLAFAATLDPIVPAARAVPAHRDATLVSIDGTGHSGLLVAPDAIAQIVVATRGARRTGDRRHLLAA